MFHYICELLYDGFINGRWFEPLNHCSVSLSVRSYHHVDQLFLKLGVQESVSGEFCSQVKETILEWNHFVVKKILRICLAMVLL